MVKGIGQYKQIDIETALTNASPHRLIQMLFEGALQSLAKAKGVIAHQQPELLSTHIKKTSNILLGLEEGLDLEKGGQIAANLQALYQFMQTELISVQREQSEERLEALIRILSDLKEGWDGIAPKSENNP